MSYILDALKKAESDRLNEGIPVIAAPVERFRAPEAPRNKRWLWAALPLAAMTVAVPVWFGIATEKNAETPPAVVARLDPPAAMSPPVAIPVPEAVPPKPLPKVPAPVEKPIVPDSGAMQKPVVTKPASASTTRNIAPVQRVAPERRAEPAPNALSDRMQTAERKAAPEQTAAPAPSQARLPALHELPEQVRRQIPQFSIDGYLYSGNRADRSVLINRRLLHEGDQIAPGLVIEEMRPQEMVLNYNGQRYRSSY